VTQSYEWLGRVGGERGRSPAQKAGAQAGSGGGRRRQRGALDLGNRTRCRAAAERGKRRSCSSASLTVGIAIVQKVTFIHPASLTSLRYDSGWVALSIGQSQSARLARVNSRDRRSSLSG
jgi:hypothetical protein